VDWTPYIGTIVTALITAGATYAAIVSRLSKLEVRIDHVERHQIDTNTLSAQIAALSQKVDDLREDVSKHNRVVERTYKTETDMETMWKRHDELKERIHDLEQYHKKEA
jgi:outer membrane murein-binding lipoprotein Lpp